ncbi:MAG: hypothetical protein PHR87_14610, partial [Sulfurospirillaceae bacterium]|nr:hypothetical protein [Sulfurospirillaceae bacterium]
MFKNMTIASKLLSISIFTVLGLAVLSYVSISSSVIGKESLETIYAKNVVPDNEVSVAKNTFETILNDLIHVTSEFLPIGQARDRILVTEKKMNAFFEKALKSDFYDDPTLKQNLNEAYKAYTDKIVPNFKKIHELYVKDNREDIGDMAVEMEAPCRYVSTRFDNISKFTSQRVQTISTEISAKLDKNLYIVVIISILILLITSGLLLIVSRYIVKRIERIGKHLS